MHPLRVLAACLCLATSQCMQVSGTPTIARTPRSLDALAKPGGQANGTRSPVEIHAPNSPTTTEPQHNSTSCQPQRIDVQLMEDQPMIVNYTVEVNQPNNCGGIMYVVSCEDPNNTIDYFFYSVNGSVCIKEENSYRLKYKDLLSDCFNRGIPELTHEDVTFQNDGEASVKFYQLPWWVKELEIWLVAMNGTTAGTGKDSVTEEEVHKIIVPGNYALYQKYFLSYSPVILQKGKGNECRDLRQKDSKGFLYWKGGESKSDVDNTKTVLILSIIAGVLCLLLVAVAINIYLCRASDKDQQHPPNPRTSLLHLIEPTSDKCDGNVVLVHAEDTTHLARLCQDLKAAVTKYCCRRVVDISLSDVQRLASPETWLLQMLSNQNNTVLLVLSPALAAIHRAIQQGNDVAGCKAVANVRGEMRPWDVLLPICLRYLLEHLSQNYVRLFVVRFEEVSSSQAHNISELVPSKRYLLPQHQLDLQSALKIIHV